MLNSCVLLGRLTTEPELKSTPGGVAVLSLILAVERDRKGVDGNKQTDFIRTVAWRQTAEFITRYFHKGDLIAVHGSIQTHSYEDKVKKHTITEVNIEQAYFAGNTPAIVAAEIDTAGFEVALS